MDNIKFEDLLEKIINENDDDIEVCRMVEECKEEEERKKQMVDSLKYITEDKATIYTSENQILYQYPDGHQFVINTNANTGILNINSTSGISNALGTIADSTDGTIPF